MKSSVRLSRLTPSLLSVLRLVAAFVYIAHGTQKLFGVPGHPFHAPVLTLTLFGAAGVIETIGGILMLLGLFTRPVAFVLSGQMAVAFFTQHWPRGFWPINNGGELAVLFCGGVSLPHRFDGAYLTLSADAAAQAAEVLGARAVVPVHFEGWAHFTQGAAELREAFARAGIGDRLVVPERGARVTV